VIKAISVIKDSAGRFSAAEACSRSCQDVQHASRKRYASTGAGYLKGFIGARPDSQERAC